MHAPRTPIRRRSLALAVSLVAVVMVTACGQIPSADSTAEPTGAAGPTDGSTARSAGHAPSSNQSRANSGHDDGSGPSPSASGAQDCSYVRTGKAARDVHLPPTRNIAMHGTPEVVIKLTTGRIRLKLDRSRAPCTVNSFLSLAKQGFYDKTSCPRLTSEQIFMLQCGDPTGGGKGGPGYTFTDELGGDETYPAGTVAMANSGPNTNGSQFFLVYRDSDIDPKYTVFGEMSIKGQRVLSKIAAKGDDGSNPRGGGKPKAEAKIVSVTVE